MISGFIAALVMAGAPAPAPQTAPRAASGPVTVEVVASAHIDAPATAFTLTTTLSVEGKDRAAADAALAAKRAEVAAALAGAGIPASAIGPAPEIPNPFLGTVKLDTTTVTEVPAIDMDALMTEDGEESTTTTSGDTAAESQVMITEAIAVRTTSIPQATAAKAALEKLDLTVGDPRVSLANADAVHREAKKKAIAKARADADAYAAALGLRVIRVARVSEAGGSLLLPQLQGAVMGVMEIFETGQEIPRGSLRISETVTVEFVVAP